jgi:tail tube protein
MAGESQAIVTNGTKLLRGDGVTPTEGFTEIAEVVTITPPSQDPVEVDVSHLLSQAREKRAGLPDTGSAEFQINYLPENTGHRDLFTEANAVGQHPLHNWRIMFPAPNDTHGIEFPASVGSFNFDEIGLDGVIRATVSLISSPPALVPATIP